MGFDFDKVLIRDFSISCCSCRLALTSGGGGRSLIRVFRMFCVILSTDDKSDRLMSNLICFKAVCITASFVCLPCFAMH